MDQLIAREKDSGNGVKTQSPLISLLLHHSHNIPMKNISRDGGSASVSNKKNCAIPLVENQIKKIKTKSKLALTLLLVVVAIMNIKNPSSIQTQDEYLAYLAIYKQLCEEVTNGAKTKRTEKALFGAFLAEWETKQSKK